MTLSASECVQIKAAEGWLDLGNFLEANDELEEIAPVNRAHPDVLETRCRIYEAAGKWAMSLVVAKTLCDQLPKWLPGWLHQGRSLHELGRTHEAYHLLVDVVELFPDNQTIRYDIAVYAVQRGMLDEAVEWLKLVFKVDGDAEFRKKALDDPRLDQVWADSK